MVGRRDRRYGIQYHVGQENTSGVWGVWGVPPETKRWRYIEYIFRMSHKLSQVHAPMIFVHFRKQNKVQPMHEYFISITRCVQKWKRQPRNQRYGVKQTQDYNDHAPLFTSMMASCAFWKCVLVPVRVVDVEDRAAHCRVANETLRHEKNWYSCT